MKRGEVQWDTFKPPGKKRPVLVLTRDSILEYLGEVTVAPITSTTHDIPSEVVLTADDGMPKDCAVDFFQAAGNFHTWRCRSSHQRSPLKAKCLPAALPESKGGVLRPLVGVMHDLP